MTQRDAKPDPKKRPLCPGSGSSIELGTKGHKMGLCATCRHRVPLNRKTKQLHPHYEPIRRAHAS